MTEQRCICKQEYDGQTLDHVIVHDETGRVLPTVIIIPTVMGVQPLEIGFAEKLVGARLSCRRRRPVRPPLHGRRRPGGAPLPRWASCAPTGRRCAIGCWPSSKRFGSGRMSTRTGSRSIGYCFGGQCALDVARSGADVAGVASFPRPVRPARPAAPADQGQGRRLPWLERPDGPARSGGGAWAMS